MEPLQFTIQDGNGELTKEEFLRGAREDQSVIDVLSLYQRDEITQQPLISTSNTAFYQKLPSLTAKRGRFNP